MDFSSLLDNPMMRQQTADPFEDGIANIPNFDAKPPQAGRETLSDDVFDASTLPPPEWEDATTVMMRNIPNKYAQRMLLAEINHAGFLGAFDFFYLPIDPETNANRGYAFINFIDPGFAWMFKLAYEGRKMNRFNSSKVISVNPATLQGFEANYAHYSSARVNRGDPAARPLFLRESKVAPIPWAGGGGGRRRDKAGGRGNIRNAGQQGGGDWQQPYWPASGSGPMPPYPGGGVGGANAFASPYLNAGGYPGASGGASPSGAAREANAAASENPGAPMVPRFCSQCGGGIQPQFQFCPLCGASLDFSAVNAYNNQREGKEERL